MCLQCTEGILMIYWMQSYDASQHMSRVLPEFTLGLQALFVIPLLVFVK